MPQQTFTVYAAFERNEGMAVFCGYYLKNRGFREDIFDFLINSLRYEGARGTETDYVRWYAARAAARAFTGALSGHELKLLAAVLPLLGAAD